MSSSSSLESKEAKQILSQKIALVFDFDLTCSEEYQQISLVNEYLREYQRFYNTEEKIKEIQSFVPEYKGFTRAENFFDLLKYQRNKILSFNPHARLQPGVTWMQLLQQDMLPGHPLEQLTDEKLSVIGKKIMLSPGIIECFRELKRIWSQKNIDLSINIISVGLKQLIVSALDGSVDNIFACEIDMKTKIITNVVEPYSKTEYAFEIAKGGKDKKDVKMRGADYKIPYSKFICIGDSATDISNFRFFRKNGAVCVMVYEAGSLEKYNESAQIALREVDYLLERDYSPVMTNPTWKYLNDIIDMIVSRKCTHSPYSIHAYRWSKQLSPAEVVEIEQHLLRCHEHEPGLRLIHCVPRNHSS